MHVAALLLMVLAPTVRAADPEMVELLLPDAKFVMGVNVAGLRQSAVAQQMAAEAKSAAPDWMRLTQAAGFDPLEMVDEVLLASSGEGKNAPTVAVLRGNFAALRATAGERNYRGFPLVGGTGAQTGLMALIDDTLAVAGEFAHVRAAIDGRGASVSLSPGFTERIAEMESKYDIWGFGKVPAGALPPAEAKSAAASAARAIDQVRFGLTVRSGLEVAADLHARTAKDAQSMAQSVQLLTSMLAAQPGGEAARKSLDVRMDGNWVRLALRVPEEAMRKALAARPPARSPAAAAPAGPPSRVPAGAALMITSTEPDGGVTVVQKK